jgi:hypothetical protein
MIQAGQNAAALPQFGFVIDYCDKSARRRKPIYSSPVKAREPTPVNALDRIDEWVGTLPQRRMEM